MLGKLFNLSVTNGGLYLLRTAQFSNFLSVALAGEQLWSSTSVGNLYCMISATRTENNQQQTNSRAEEDQIIEKRVGTGMFKNLQKGILFDAKVLQ